METPHFSVERRSYYGISIMNNAVFNPSIFCEFEINETDAGGDDYDYRLNHTIDASYVDVWKHVACTLEGNIWKMYIDGVEVITSQYIRDTPNPAGINGKIPSTAPANFYIGAEYQSSADTEGSDVMSRFFLGSVDEVAVFNQALSAAEISQLYQNSLNSQGYCSLTGTSYSGNIIHGHRGEEIIVNVNGSIKTLQEAIDDSSIVKANAGTSPAQYNSYPYGNNANETWIANKLGYEKTLQQAINDGDFKCGGGEVNVVFNILGSYGSFTFYNVSSNATDGSNITYVGFAGGGAETVQIIIGQNMN